MNEGMLAKWIRSMSTYAARIKTKPLYHSSIPGWRGRALTNVRGLHRNISALNEIQLTVIIGHCDQFIVSYNNSTGGYHDWWVDTRAEFKERLEYLQEIDDDTHNDADNVFTDNDGHLVPIQNRCIPINCKYCEHHGYLYADKPEGNTYSSTYRCSNIIADRYGLLMSGGLLCKYSERPDWSK